MSFANTVTHKIFSALSTEVAANAFRVCFECRKFSCHWLCCKIFSDAFLPLLCESMTASRSVMVGATLLRCQCIADCRVRRRYQTHWSVSSNTFTTILSLKVCLPFVLAEFVAYLLQSGDQQQFLYSCKCCWCVMVQADMIMNASWQIADMIYHNQLKAEKNKEK